MSGRFDDGRILADIACVVDQLSGTVEQFLALIALISSSFKILATRADTHDKPVS
mgnify:CR=1 FL=1